MKPSTLKTGRSPSTQLRKVVFGGSPKKHDSHNQINRRHFLATSGAAMVLPLILPGCANFKTDEQRKAINYTFGPGSTAPYPVKKDTRFRVNNLRSGAIKTSQGWNVQDFAHSLFNPNSEEITISLKMDSDDPNFVFSNGQKGTFTKTYKVKPLFGVTDNVFRCPIFEKYKPDWPVSAETNFTGSVEFSSSKPFYYYLLHLTPACEAANVVDAYFAAWNPCRYDEAGVWDTDLNKFVIPYTNYWHNETTWKVGWHSTLVIRNNTDQTVTYAIRHIPFYGGQYNPESGQITFFKEESVDIRLQRNEEKRITLMELYGWSTNAMASMEGCLFISPDRTDATGNGTTMRLLIVPNESGKPLHDAISH